MVAPRIRFGPAAAGATILFFYALDQATKRWVIHLLPLNSEMLVVPNLFTLVYWANTGAAFSSFEHSNGMFVALSLVTLAVIAFYAIRGAFQHVATRLSMALLFAGVLGNMTDRITHGYVVDFLLFDLHVRFAHPWPAFNVADSCICTAAAIMVIGAWLEERQGKL